MDITPLRSNSNLMNWFNKVVFLRFYNKLMLGLSPTIKISVSWKSGHSTIVLSTIDI